MLIEDLATDLAVVINNILHTAELEEPDTHRQLCLRRDELQRRLNNRCPCGQMEKHDCAGECGAKETHHGR